MMQKNNRKSHLAAPLSPSTQALLKSEGPFAGGGLSPSRDTSMSKTPTSGEIPIAASAGTSAPSQYAPDKPQQAAPERAGVQRVLSADPNGSGLQTSLRSPAPERPAFPPRTSSTSVLPSPSPSNSQSMVMPIRAAPPPGGLPGLPPNPASTTSGARRQMYSYGEEGR